MRLLAPKTEAMSVLHQALVVLFVLTALWCTTVYARIPASVASIGLGALCLTRVNWTLLPVQVWSGGPNAAFSYFRQFDYSSLGALPLIYALAFLWTSDLGTTASFFRIALPSLGISGAFFVLREVIDRYRIELLGAFVLFAFVSSIGVLSYSLANQEALIVALGQGRAVPTPISHVRYSTMLAVATLVAAYLVSLREVRRDIRGLVLLVGLLLFVTLHVIAVRSGLVLCYLGLFLFGSRLVLERFNLVKGFGFVTVLLLLGLTIAWQVPSIERKFAYTLWEFENFTAEDVPNFSDGARRASFEAGWALVSASPWLGVVEGGFRQNMTQAYAALGYADTGHLPTNQFLFSWSLAGVLGLLAVIAFLLGPTLETGWYRRPLLLEFMVMFALLFLVETPLA